MEPVKKILCAIDFSEATTPVTRYASMLAAMADAEVVVVYVAPELERYNLFEVPTQDITRFVTNIITGAERNMQERLEDELANVRARGVVKSGYAPNEIIETAKSENADLIVIGSHGRTGVDRIIFGSVAEKVVKQSPVPVLTVPIRSE